VLIKGGTFLEALGEVRVVAFDKTGTLTAGRPEVVEVLTGPNGRMSEGELIGIASALEARSEHPIADAIRRRAAASGDGAPGEVTGFESLSGRGARARVGDAVYQIGRPDLFRGATTAWSAELERVAAAGRTPICVGTTEEVLGVVAVADRPRRDARDAVTGLRRLGVERIVMLTGDHEATARAMAEELGIEEYYAGLMPEEKVEKVRELERTAGRVAMVGDGVNDAPALAAATVGIAMGAAGSDAALESADVALMSDDLSGLPYLFRLSRTSKGVIRQNVLASITLKLSLAAGVFPGWVSLITAVLVGDMGASLGVTTNALRLARLRR
jgi:Cd2+/Zn2+-exporting ATPase